MLLEAIEDISNMLLFEINNLIPLFNMQICQRRKKNKDFTQNVLHIDYLYTVSQFYL